MNRRYLPVVSGALGALVFCLLLERFSLPGALLGAGMGAAGAHFAPPVRACAHPVQYGVRLLWEVLRGALATARAAFRAAAPAAVIELTPHTGARGRALVANSITLTPGTVTLDADGAHYAVLCLDPPADEAGRSAVAGAFEARLGGEGADA